MSKQAKKKLVPASVMHKYLLARRGYTGRLGESLVAAVADEIRKQIGAPKTNMRARNFVERHGDIVMSTAHQQHATAPIAAKPNLRRSKPQTVASAAVSSDEFLRTFEWRRVRMLALKKYGPRCQCCGATPDSGAVMNVDHIKPRNLFPELALDVNNLQILCAECNHGKGNWDMTDWRKGMVMT